MKDNSPLEIMLAKIISSLPTSEFFKACEEAGMKPQDVLDILENYDLLD
jgi:hypothetical protein